MAPFFSVVIPTRDRAETLEFTLKTVLEQNFTDYEIIISDNSDFPDTKCLIDRLDNNKIRYFKTPQALSMVENWNFALGKVNGGFIIIIGDDDGLVNGSLKYLYKLLWKGEYEVVSWDRVYYSWPSIPIEEEENICYLPLNVSDRVLDSKKTISNVFSFKVPYTELPMLYNSVISNKVLKKLSEIDGLFLNSTQPDIYSGFAIAYQLKEYLKISKPMSINAGSAKSNGIATFLDSDSSAKKDFITLNQKSQKIKYHPRVPNIRSISSCILDAYFCFLEKYGFDTKKYDDKFIINYILKDVVIYSEEEKKKLLTTISKIIANAEVKFLHNKVEQLTVKKVDRHKVKIGFNGTYIVLNMASFNIFDVYDVSIFTSKFYDFDGDVLIKKDYFTLSRLKNRLNFLRKWV